MIQINIILNLVSFFITINIILGQNVQGLTPVLPEKSKPVYELEEISDLSYQDAFDKNENDPLRTDYYSNAVCPRKDSDFYKITVKDQGYSDELPIDVEVFFAVGPDGLLEKNSYFALADTPDSPRYGDIFILMDHFGSEQNDIYFSIWVDNVGLYDSEGKECQSISYSYHAFTHFDLITMEPKDLTVKRSRA